jgi:enoyl-CoA hydratase/carnithine racemase
MINPTSFDLTRDEATGIVTLTLNRPARGNALTFAIYEELTATFRALSSDRTVRVIVLTGTGKAFCTGGDVHEIIGPLLSRDYQGLLEFTRLTCALVASIRACPLPIVAALNGTVAGAGAVIATACDIRIAARSARIAFLFTRVGLSGADMGAAWLLPRIVGFGRASELLMTGDFISADEAYRIGLYNRVVPDGEAAAEAYAVAARLAKGPGLALALTKDALNREAAMDLTSALEAEAQVQAGLMLHGDFREAYRAFVDKREPSFR